jgi:hypothetical protein
MKKIMFILAFVGIGLFASASNGKVEKIKLPINKEVKKSKNEMSSLPPSVYIRITCANGNQYTVCCYWSTQTANLAAPGWADELCN